MEGFSLFSDFRGAWTRIKDGIPNDVRPYQIEASDAARSNIHNELLSVYTLSQTRFGRWASAFGIQVETEIAIQCQFSNSLQALNPPSNASGA
jgi:hypothetical protein